MSRLFYCCCVPNRWHILPWTPPQHFFTHTKKVDRYYVAMRMIDCRMDKKRSATVASEDVSKVNW